MLVNFSHIRIAIILGLVIGFFLVGYGIIKILESYVAEDVQTTRLQQEYLEKTSIFEESTGISATNILSHITFYFDWDDSFPGTNREVSGYYSLCFFNPDDQFADVVIFHEDEREQIISLVDELVENPDSPDARFELILYKSEKAWGMGQFEISPKFERDELLQLQNASNCNDPDIRTFEMLFSTPGNYYYLIMEFGYGEIVKNFGGPIIYVPSKGEELEVDTNLAILSSVMEQRKSNLLIEGISWIGIGAIPLGLSITMVDRFFWSRTLNESG